MGISSDQEKLYLERGYSSLVAEREKRSNGGVVKEGNIPIGEGN